MFIYICLGKRKPGGIADSPLRLECTLSKVNLDRSGLYEDQTGEVCKVELS